MIAAGNTYEQILAAYPDLNYLDIFRAAQEALDVAAKLPGGSTEPFAEQRKRYPRAYLWWTDEEDRLLAELVKSGMTVAQIAGRLERNRGAIRSRIIKMNLINDLSQVEQARLKRIARRGGISIEG
jgi:hypothetical protein